MFPDKNLYLAILYTVDDVRGIVTDLPENRNGITIEYPMLRDIAALSSLDVPNRGISDLTGIDYAYQLSVLNLSNNSISDISPLARIEEPYDSIPNRESDFGYVSALPTPCSKWAGT